MTRLLAAAALLSAFAVPRAAHCEPLHLPGSRPASPASATPPPAVWLVSSAPVDLKLPPAAAPLLAATPGEPDTTASQRPRVIRRGELLWLGAGTALLLATDKSTVRWFDPDLGHHPAGEKIGKDISKFGTGLPLAALILAPAALDGKYGRRTSELTAMALVNTTILTEGIKIIAGRERPFQSDGRTRFHGFSTTFESFPSGHTSASFAVAEVLGNRYPRYKLPLYLFATTIAWARINAAQHFPSDVFFGAALGIYDGRFVLRHGAKLFPWK